MIIDYWILYCTEILYKNIHCGQIIYNFLAILKVGNLYTKNI